MTTEERDARLTAYALNDPGLSAADRTEIETNLQADPASRLAIEETRKLAALLTTGLAAEQAALPAEAPVAIPLTAAKKAKSPQWPAYAVAASVLLLVFGGLYAVVDAIRTQGREIATAATPSAAEPSTDSLGDESRAKSSTGTPNLEYAPRGDTAAAAITPAEGFVPGDGEKSAARGKTEGATGGRNYYQDSIPPANPTSPGYSAKGPATPAKGGFGGGFGGGGFGGVTPGMPGPGGGGFNGAPAGTPSPRGGGGALPGASGPAVGSGGPAAEFERALRPTDAISPPGNVPPGGAPKATTELAQPDTYAVDSAPSTNDRYAALVENRFIKVEGPAVLSTFGVDVDTASYAIVRKYLSMGQMPPGNAVRLEEMVNYFRYQDKAPESKDPFAVTVEVAECPWQPKHRLARIGVKAKPIANDKRPPSNLVFLVDVSGSMNEPAKLPMVKASLRMLVNQLGENDRVAMVVYAGTTGLVLDSTSAMHKDRILGALDRLEAGGSTNGSGGLQQAYAVAVANFIKNGTNRVILCTDGDWNVGTTSTEELVAMVEEKRKTGVFLSVFGFGMGNLRDEMMVKLAGKGNGNYGYIDTLKEANKALVEQLGGTLVTVAKDVKIQVEFNPATVSSYRLLGYEKRALATKDFADDTKDAGEMGAGHVVTALYELVPAGHAVPGEPKLEGLRYQPNPEPRPAGKAGEAFVVKMRHKKPDSDVSTLRELPVTDTGKGYADASEDFRFSAAVASFAMLLRNSPNKGEATFALVNELAEAAKKHDPGGYRAEFIEMVRQAKTISGKP